MCINKFDVWDYLQNAKSVMIKMTLMTSCGQRYASQVKWVFCSYSDIKSHSMSSIHCLGYAAPPVKRVFFKCFTECSPSDLWVIPECALSCSELHWSVINDHDRLGFIRCFLEPNTLTPCNWCSRKSSPNFPWCVRPLQRPYLGGLCLPFSSNARANN